MLNFTQAKGLENESPTTTEGDLNGAEIELFRDMVLRRFFEGVRWEEITAIYLAGLVTETDLEIIQRAVASKGKGLTA